jgi:hypothetical protein
VTIADVDLIDDYLGGEDPDGHDYFDGPVLTATRWRNNAHMVSSLAGEGLYLRPEWETIDLTTNSGKWWKEWRPDRLVTNDLDPKWNTDLHENIRTMPSIPDGTRTSGFKVVCVDLPYVSIGGRKTSTIPDFNDNYGLHDAPRNPAETLVLLKDGLTTAARIAKIRNVGRAAKDACRRGETDAWDPVGGIVLYKCTNYISSQTLQPVVVDIINHARTIPGLRFEDWFLHLGEPGAQPKERGKPDVDGKRRPHVQKHGRSNCSHLLVFRRIS